MNYETVLCTPNWRDWAELAGFLAFFGMGAVAAIRPPKIMRRKSKTAVFAAAFMLAIIAFLLAHLVFLEFKVLRGETLVAEGTLSKCHNTRGRAPTTVLSIGSNQYEYLSGGHCENLKPGDEVRISYVKTSVRDEIVRVEVPRQPDPPNK